jgi:hypothetical protein
MREVRIFELEHSEPAAAWRVARPSTFKVTSGQVWLTIDGEGIGGVDQYRAGRRALRVGERFARPVEKAAVRLADVRVAGASAKRGLTSRYPAPPP